MIRPETTFEAFAAFFRKRAGDLEPEAVRIWRTHVPPRYATLIKSIISLNRSLF